jgi:hypothetical protein
MITGPPSKIYDIRDILGLMTWESVCNSHVATDCCSDEHEHWPQFTQPGSAVLGGVSVHVETPFLGFDQRMS